jgi:hypothetical protein
LSCLDFQYLMTGACLTSQAGLIVIPRVCLVCILFNVFSQSVGRFLLGTISPFPSWKVSLHGLAQMSVISMTLSQLHLPSVTNISLMNDYNLPKMEWNPHPSFQGF